MTEGPAIMKDWKPGLNTDSRLDVDPWEEELAERLNEQNRERQKEGENTDGNQRGMVRE